MLFYEILKDVLKDTWTMFPFIFLTYIIIELVERKAEFARNGKFLGGKLAPLYGAMAGVFPQCGISVMAAKLYDKNLIRIGTLFAVFISTSDEAFAILLSSNQRIMLIPLILIKVVFAVIVGYAMNYFYKRRFINYKKKELGFEHEEICKSCSEHEGKYHEGKLGVAERYVFYPLLHTLQTYLFIFVIMFIFGLIFGDNGLIGVDKFNSFCLKTKYVQPFIAGLVGLIPNCASSVLLTTAYLQGALNFGALITGLSVNAGVGMAILFKNTAKFKRNILILISLYLLSCVVGFIVIGVMALIG